MYNDLFAMRLMICGLFVFACQVSHAFDGALDSADAAVARRAASALLHGEIESYKFDVHRSGCYFDNPCTSMTQRDAWFSKTESEEGSAVVRRSWVLCKAETRSVRWLCHRSHQTAQVLSLYDREFLVAANVDNVAVLNLLRYVRSECYAQQKVALSVTSPLWPPDDRLVKVAGIGFEERRGEYMLQLPLNFNQVFSLRVKPVNAPGPCAYEIVGVSSVVL